MLRLVSSLARLDLTKIEKTRLLVWGEAVESKLVKLETSCTVILPPTVSVQSFLYAQYVLLGFHFGRK